MRKFTVDVIIRYEGKGRADRKDWHLSDILAVFPSEVGDDNPRSMSCYSAVGGHATCATGYIGRKTKPTTLVQTRTMLAHLRSLPGYEDIDLHVVKRATVNHYRARVKALKGE